MKIQDQVCKYIIKDLKEYINNKNGEIQALISYIIKCININKNKRSNNQKFYKKVLPP